MAQVREIPVPEGSLLAAYGNDSDYHDCFARDVPENVSLEDYIHRFYRSRAFLPERLVLKALGKPASSADVRALADGKTDCFGVWEVFGRKADQILLESKSTGTASWLAVGPLDGGTRLYFGSWVGSIGESGWKAMLEPHLWYSRALLEVV